MEQGMNNGTPEPTVRRFDACPNCGSEERLFGSLSKKLREMGYAREEWNMVYDAKQGPISDPAWEKKVPIGTRIPGFSIKTDICCDCGLVYAVEIGIGHASKKLPIQLPPGMNRPGLS
jgi:hypothetical protein